jgi:Papain family cysteine protease
MDKEECFTEMVDHTVLVMGYSLFEGTKPYWIIRNSWGVGWGEKGYMRLAYTGGLGICGIHSTPAIYPVLDFSGMLLLLTFLSIL